MNALLGLGLLFMGAKVFTFREAPEEPYDPSAYALDPGAQRAPFDCAPISAAFDRPLDLPPPPAPAPPAELPATPPPPLTLLAVLSDERGTDRYLAIVHDGSGVQRVLQVGDEVPGAKERWRVARMKLVPHADQARGVLTLESPTRVQNYEAIFRAGSG